MLVLLVLVCVVVSFWLMVVFCFFFGGRWCLLFVGLYVLMYVKCRLKFGGRFVV